MGDSALGIRAEIPRLGGERVAKSLRAGGDICTAADFDDGYSRFAVGSLPKLVDRKYGLSVQSWGSWFWDWTKGQFLAVVLGIVLVSILYAVIRSSPRRWWFYFWLVSLPIGVFRFSCSR